MSKESYRKKKLRKKDKEFKYNYNQKSSNHCTFCETRAGGKIIYKNSTEAKKSIPKTKGLLITLSIFISLLLKSSVIFFNLLLEKK